MESAYMMYAYFESRVVLEDNGKQNLDKSYMKKQKHATCHYGYKLVGVDGEFSKPFQSHLGEDDAYSFIDSMVNENKY